MSRNASLSYNLRGFFEMIATLPLSPILRKDYNYWGTTPEEQHRSYPGDDLIPNPKLEYTRAITINAPARDIWPWLMQIGYGRGGLYSYDGLENLIGCNLHSADVLLEDVAPFQVGDLMQMGPEGYPAQFVLAIEPEQYLLLGAGPQLSSTEQVIAFDLANPTPPEGDRASWLFFLDEQPNHTTRLIVRACNQYQDSFGPNLMWRIVEPINFVMEKAMLRGIKARAEALAGASTLV